MKHLTLTAALVAASSLISPVSCLAQEAEDGNYGSPGYTGGGPPVAQNPAQNPARYGAPSSQPIQKPTQHLPETPAQNPATITAPAATVRAIDGDTIEVAGRRVRLAAIDAPELDQLCDDDKGTAWRCGAYAAAVLAVGLAKARPEMVTCTLEPVPDRYGRSVGVCTVPGEDGPVDIAGVQVLLGFAVPYYKYGGTRYEGEYTWAKANKRGMHAGYFEPPAAYRQRRAGRN